MFDLGWAEILVVLVVTLLVVGPEDLPRVLHGIKQFVQKLSALAKECMDSCNAVVGDDVHAVKEELKTIIDMEGNEREVYDLSDFMPPPDEPPTKTSHKGDSI